ncbi:hypothetical protein [Gimesia algae]|uniref:Uncharacterized protein n=1 Tax=Gimesia algae TaxID=2527971 RepID=A0A517V9H2_9PLAN|nr:hypothetical protein [Gimesia algae]QDT89647.1 hypothetical protein Pan161_12790 [Gimesia algae]
MGFFDRFKSKPAATKINSADSVARIMVVLECDGDQVLFILLIDDGTINRMGTGAEENEEQDLYIGKSDTAAFQAVRSICSPVIDAWIGGFGDPDAAGKPCKLLVGFQTTAGEESLSQWEYGTESKGPPAEVVAVVKHAVQATAGWYAEQKTLSAGS